MEKISEYSLSSDPAESFQIWYETARQTEDNPDAFTLATASRDATPSARILLLKGQGAGPKFRFFTHSFSQKGRDLQQNPQASMVFYWIKCERQVRIRGEVREIDESETKAYFASRAHESQVASYISEQGQAIESRKMLEQKFFKALEQFPKGQVPLPKSWRGYELVASEMEFFVYGEHRLNDRFLYVKNDQGNWEITRLQP